MKIVYLITRADAVGGASIHVRDLARAMPERGHDATVLVGGTGPVTEQLESAGVPFQSLRWLKRALNPFEDTLALGEAVGALARLKPDLVSTHTAKAGWIGRAACRLLSIPVLYTPHGWPARERLSSRIGGLLSGLAEKTAARWSDRIICVCEHEKRLALELGIAQAGKLEVIHNGVRDIGEELRARPERTPVRLCSVARFESPKDHETLLRALAPLRTQPWELDLAGDGPREAKIRRLAQELGLAGRVKFHGYVADPSVLLAQGQVFVLSSRSEAFPRSILEALRAGLPVVAADVGGVGEAVRPGVNGLLVPAENPPALAGALGKLLGDARLRQAMGEEARATYERRFRVEVMVERTVAVYARVRSRTAPSLRPA
jgi:glycosyltransferase involved in cell wall biosynthesis